MPVKEREKEEKEKRKRKRKEREREKQEKRKENLKVGLEVSAGKNCLEQQFSNLGYACP